MKLIDLLVDELQELGGWPDGARCAACDPDGEVRFYGSGTIGDFYPKQPISKTYRGSFCGDRSKSVTREQYEAALAPKNDGWINWGGGECPLAKGTPVDFKLRSGAIHEDHMVGEIVGERWYHSSEPHRARCDIIAYRLHKPEVKAVEWSGKGLPPVGVECETNTLKNGWVKCKILANTEMAGKSVAVFQAGDKITYSDENCFRPIPSARDKAIEALSLVILESHADDDEDMNTETYIYDAIAAGKIPGVKLDD